MASLPLVTIYPAIRDILILRNSTFRKRWVLKINGVEVDTATVDFDADIKDSAGAQVGTFGFSLPESAPGVTIPGVFDVEMTPVETLALPIGEHNWDLSFTFTSGDFAGDRFYLLTGKATVQETQSRND